MVKLPNEVVEITNWAAPMQQNTFGWRWLHVEDFWTPPSPWRQLREYLALAQDVRIVTPGTRCENSYPWHQMRKYFSLMPVWGIYLSRGPNWKNYYLWRQLRKCLSLAPAESMFIPGASWELSLYLYSLCRSCLPGILPTPTHHCTQYQHHSILHIPAFLLIKFILFYGEKLHYNYAIFTVIIFFIWFLCFYF